MVGFKILWDRSSEDLDVFAREALVKERKESCKCLAGCFGEKYEEFYVVKTLPNRLPPYYFFTGMISSL